MAKKYQTGGHESIENGPLKFHASAVNACVASGVWSREHAEAFFTASSVLTAPLAASIHDRSDRYAATAHVVCEALALQAKQRPHYTYTHAPHYTNLTGDLGLATDPAWLTLLQPEAEPGLSFTTDGLTRALADEAAFPNDKGLHRNLSIDGCTLQDSDVVCFQSAPSDAEGHHSLLPVPFCHSRFLPPLATVTLESVQAPGEWEVRGLRVKQRLFTVSVSFPI